MLGLLLAVTWAGFPVRSAHAAAPDPGDPSDQLNRRWMGAMMSSGYSHTRSEAVDMARAADLIVALPNMFSGHLGAMRAANPDLLVYVYMNGAFAYRTEGDRFPASWYMRDADGKKIRSTNYSNYLMDLHSWGWRAHVADECTAHITDTGFDGCYLDMLGTAPLFDGYTTTPPINSQTGAEWTRQEWIAATGRIGRTVNQRNAGVSVIGNGLGHGRRYTDSSRPLIHDVDAVVAESWLRNATSPAEEFRDETQWLADIEMIADAESRGGVVMAMTKLNTTATRQLRDAWREYTMASFLLATDGTSYLAFHEGKSRDDVTAAHPWESIDLGQPAAPHRTYTKADGAYQRTFARGRVLVNPTDAAVTVRLDRTYVDVRGEETDRIVLPPHSGRILRHADAQPTPDPDEGAGSDGVADSTSFTGQVSASGTRRQAHTFHAEAGQDIAATLNWDNRDADLSLFLKDPTGSIVAMNATDSERPKAVHHTADLSGEWRLEVKAVRRHSAYQLDVDLSSAGGVGWSETGQVDASANRRQPHSVDLQQGEVVTVSLEWTEPDAVLSVFLRNPVGEIVAFNAAPEEQPKTVSYTAGRAGEWRIEVKAVEGAADYEVRLD